MALPVVTVGLTPSYFRARSIHGQFLQSELGAGLDACQGTRNHYGRTTSAFT